MNTRLFSLLALAALAFPVRTFSADLRVQADLRPVRMYLPYFAFGTADGVEYALTLNLMGSDAIGTFTNATIVAWDKDGRAVYVPDANFQVTGALNKREFSLRRNEIQSLAMSGGLLTIGWMQANVYQGGANPIVQFEATVRAKKGGDELYTLPLKFSEASYTWETRVSNDSLVTVLNPGNSVAEVIATFWPRSGGQSADSRREQVGPGSILELRFAGGEGKLVLDALSPIVAAAFEVRGKAIAAVPTFGWEIR